MCTMAHEDLRPGRMGVKTMIARTVADTRYHQGFAQPRTDLLRAAIRTIHAMAEHARWAAWRWYQAHQTRKQLFALPDHMLKDIGLSRPMLVSATVHRVREEEAIRRSTCR
jgi:uncharacterized protein YjiS (DUF1127 family)